MPGLKICVSDFTCAWCCLTSHSFNCFSHYSTFCAQIKSPKALELPALRPKARFCRSHLSQTGELYSCYFPRSICWWCWPQSWALLATTALPGSWDGSAPLWMCFSFWEIPRGSVATTQVTTAALAVVKLCAAPLLSCCLFHTPLGSREADRQNSEGKSQKKGILKANLIFLLTKCTSLLPWLLLLSSPWQMRIAALKVSLCVSLQATWQYELFAVVAHTGSTSCGHYCAYIWSLTECKWYCFNDSEVCQVRAEPATFPLHLPGHSPRPHPLWLTKESQERKVRLQSFVHLCHRMIWESLLYQTRPQVVFCDLQKTLQRLSKVTCWVSHSMYICLMKTSRTAFPPRVKAINQFIERCLAPGSATYTTLSRAQNVSIS